MTWDLGSIRRIGPITPPSALGLNRVFYVDLCTPISDNAVCNNTLGNGPVSTYVCEVDAITGEGRSGGNLIQPELQDGKLILTYVGGSADGCPDGQERITRILTQCDEIAALEPSYANTTERKPSMALLLADGPCRRTFTLTSYATCPTCTAADYRVAFELPCENGVAVTNGVKATACQGPQFVVMSSRTCSTYSFPLAAVIAVVCALVLLGLGIGWLVYRNRRIHHQYSALLAQAGGVELGPSGSGDFSNSLEESGDKEAQTL